MGTVPIVTWAVSVAGGAIPAFFVVPVRIAGIKTVIIKEYLSE